MVTEVTEERRRRVAEPRRVTTETLTRFPARPASPPPPAEAPLPCPYPCLPTSRQRRLMLRSTVRPVLFAQELLADLALQREPSSTTGTASTPATMVRLSSPPPSTSPSSLDIFGPASQQSISYIPPLTRAGMLGGFAHVSRVDIQGSRNFIAKLRLKPGNSATPTTSSSSSSSSPSSGRPRIADCGAGIGRITKGLLSTLNDGRVVVDIVEPVAKFTAAVAAGEDFAPLRDAGRIGDVYNVGLEQWEPREAAYWIIWK